MNGADSAINLLFGGLDQLGPGSDAETRRALDRIPRDGVQRVVDVGCGVGRQTLVLARELGVVIHAIDNHPPFLERLRDRATAAGLAHFVDAHCTDMADLAGTLRDVDLLWSEGAAYHLGFAGALNAWFPVLRGGAYAAITECTWLTDDRPPQAVRFWTEAYPTMGNREENSAHARAAGFEVVDAWTLPRTCWEAGYYDVLEPRAMELARHADADVRSLAEGMLAEIRLFSTAGDSYGYVFYILRKRHEPL